MSVVEEINNQAIKSIINIENGNEARYVNNNRGSKIAEKQNNEETGAAATMVILSQPRKLQESIMQRRIHPQPTNNQSMLR